MLLKICLVQNLNLAGSLLHIGTSWVIMCCLIDVLVYFEFWTLFGLGIVKLVN